MAKRETRHCSNMGNLLSQLYRPTFRNGQLYTVGLHNNNNSLSFPEFKGQRVVQEEGENN